MAKKTWNQRLRGIIGSQLGADVVEYNIEKAIISAQEAAKTSNKPVTQFYDPFTMFFGREWLIKSGTQLTFHDLRMMAKNPIIGSIINTRLNQVAAYCSPSAGNYEAGFQITKTVQGPNSKVDRNSYDPVKEYLTNFINTAGFEGMGDPHLEEFARKFIRDSLTLDQACAEVVLRQNRLPAYLVAVDGGTIRRLQAALQFESKRDQPLYAQVIDEVIVAEYTKESLMYGLRNPTTDIRLNGYGSSELEILISSITTLSNAEKYNSNSLAQGGTSKGLLVVKGDIEPTQLESFKRDFRDAISNASHGWRSPVISIGSDAQVDWVQLDRSNKDMEYSQLFEFIIKLATGVYQISPEEVNWQIGSAGATTSFNSGGKDKLTHSQEKGLRPLLNFLSTQLNSSIVRKLDPQYNLEFTGLGVGKEVEVDLRIKEVQNFKTVNEVRVESNLPPLPGGDIILNAIFTPKPAPGGDATPPTPAPTAAPAVNESKMAADNNKVAKDLVLETVKKSLDVNIEWDDIESF